MKTTKRAKGVKAAINKMKSHTPPTNKLWCAKVNLAGLYSAKPIEMRLTGLSGWWSRDGNLSADGPGLYYADGYIDFASHSKREVELFILGVNSATQLLLNWATPGNFEPPNLLPPKGKKNV